MRAFVVVVGLFLRARSTHKCEIMITALTNSCILGGFQYRKVAVSDDAEFSLCALSSHTSDIVTATVNEFLDF